MTDTIQDTITVLLVEDSAADAGLITAHLSGRTDPRFNLHHATTLSDALERLRETVADIIVLDLTLPDSSGLATFLAMSEAAHGVPIVILSGMTDSELALEAVREGAQDFFSKDKAISESLGESLQYSIERYHRQRAEREIDALVYRLYDLTAEEIALVEAAVGRG